MPSADRTYNTRDRVGMTASIQCRAGIIEVDPIQRRRKAVGVALAPDLSIGDDVESRILLCLDGHEGRIIHGLLKVGLGNPPELSGSDTRRKSPREPRAVNEPIRLWIAAHECCWKKH